MRLVKVTSINNKPIGVLLKARALFNNHTYNLLRYNFTMISSFGVFILNISLTLNVLNQSEIKLVKLISTVLNEQENNLVKNVSLDNLADFLHYFTKHITRYKREPNVIIIA